MTEKILVFDMDGTIADFYGVNGWLEYLNESNPTPYIIAEPLYDMVVLTSVLNILKTKGWKIVVTSWLAKDSTKDFDKEVRQAKREWLEEYNFPFDEIHLVKYGTTKANCTRKLGGYQILVDDNEQVRKGWNLGATINANENILDKLIDLMVAEF
jgi:hydroxymethylpyrimidine pyrophosphatase-like HAD family hydrolase